MSTACSAETALIVPQPQPMGEPRREFFPQELALSIKEEQEQLALDLENALGVQTPAQIATCETSFTRRVPPSGSKHAAMGKRKAEWSLSTPDGSQQQTEEEQSNLQCKGDGRRSPPSQTHVAASSQDRPSHAAGVSSHLLHSE